MIWQPVFETPNFFSPGEGRKKGAKQELPEIISAKEIAEEKNMTRFEFCGYCYSRGFPADVRRKITQINADACKICGNLRYFSALICGKYRKRLIFCLNPREHQPLGGSLITSVLGMLSCQPMLPPKKENGSNGIKRQSERRAAFSQPSGEPSS